MLMPVMLHRLLLAGTCLCICGAPVDLSNFNPMQDNSVLSKTEHVSGLISNVGAGGGTGPHGRPEGIDLVTQTENGDSLDRRSGLREAAGEVWSQRKEAKQIGSTSEMGDSERQGEESLELSVESKSKKEDSDSTGGRQQLDMDTGTQELASTTAPPQLETSHGHKSDQDEADRTKQPGFDSQEPEPLNPSASLWTQKLTSHSPVPFATSQTSTPMSIWGHDGTTIPSIPDPFLPEIGPNLMPREDGPESLWTEAARSGGVDTVAPLSQDETTEGTMSSEALPLIFEPFEDVTPEGGAAAAAAAAVVTLVPG
ncbi:uncharacterized protein LOC114429060 [Parambassis ranga]|uniref:Uncharacterized protein LOC114429060 n=1 Tax=Parambassis ranga TaxID=210632 RepID=A0A6P7HYW1_9TELE|nr:uncharacterized protein LOC114429060 [Parambassis ranga]